MRDNINIDPSLKLFESYRNFTGGLNTEQSNETLKESESTILENVDLLSRGSIRKREPHKLVYANTFGGTVAGVTNANQMGGQGIFKFVRGQSTIAIMAHSGKLYGSALSSDVAGSGIYPSGGVHDISADNSNWTFQTDNPIDAVQYNDTMYIVTGTRIGVLTYDASKASKFNLVDLVSSQINEYQATYVGYNLFDPSNDITNVFKDKISPNTNNFTVNIAQQGVIDTSYNAARNFIFLNNATTTGASSYLDVSGFTGVILNVKFNNSPSAFVNFQKSNDAVTWTSVSPDGSVATATNVQGTFTFTIGGSYSYFRVSVSGSVGGYITAYTQPKFLLRPPVAGDIVRFVANWDSDVVAHSSLPYSFKFEIKKFEDNDYPATAFQPYSVIPYADIPMDGYGEFDIRVTMQHTGGGGGATKTSNPAILTPLTVHPQGTKIALSTASFADAIKSCTRCIVHWNRLILYHGLSAPVNPASAVVNRIFISELDDFGYFPMYNYVDILSDATQAVTSIVRQRNQLVIFTPTQIYSMTGKSPLDYNLALINDSIGCANGWTPTVIDNDIYFAARDGVYVLRPSAYILNNFNVANISINIANTYLEKLPLFTYFGTGVIGFYFNDHYYLANRYVTATSVPFVKFLKFCVPTRAWSIDYVDVTNSTTQFAGTCGMTGVFVDGKRLFMQYTRSGRSIDDVSAPVYYASTIAVTFTNITTQYTDPTSLGYGYRRSYADLYGTSYTMKLRSKFYDFNAAFNRKKLKRIYLLVKNNEGTAANQVEDINLYVTVEADGAEVLDPNYGSVQIIGGVATWVVSSTPNFLFEVGVQMGEWDIGIDVIGTIPIQANYLNIRGKCRRTRLTIEHTDPVPCEVVAAGFQFRLKKP